MPVGAKAELEDLILQAQDQDYPQALQIKVCQKNRTIYKKQIGSQFKYFDVASITKIMSAVPLCMDLFERQILRLSEPVSKYLGYLEKTPAGEVSIKDLLSHHSGLVWWRPYYKILNKVPASERAEALKRLFRKEKLKPGKCVYSDLNFILLGWIIEEIFQMPLDEIFLKKVADPLNLKNTFYKPLDHEVSKKNIAPTEKVGSRVVQGEVHDDNTQSFGGVSAHAGLFSTLEDVSHFGNILLEIYQGKSKRPWKPSTLKIFCSRAVKITQGDFALGFWLPSKPQSTGGALISANAFGHTGFTGSSLWIDPKRNATVTILSNRTYPTRDDSRFQKLRPLLHDKIWEMLDGK